MYNFKDQNAMVYRFEYNLYEKGSNSGYQEN